ncbi:MAG: COX15/CtaA family protein [Micavibrio sp.]|nr:COX15/CtaA family protein [Micavibrio sp.]
MLDDAPVTPTVLPSVLPAARLKPVAIWLFACAAAVFLMALIGAITRLTESGLSIVKWEPIAGALPPLNAADWAREFADYKTSPQYLKVNHGMSLDDFKHIFFWEWLHRLWGRTIGVIYFLPFLYFWQRIPAARKPAFFGILAIGCFQGALGWWMVASGLVDNPAVSHYRLAAHLMTAVFLYACLFRLGLVFALPKTEPAGAAGKLHGFIRACIVAVAVTMTWGAFVAGLDAGMVYNTFPMMDSHWLPPELMQHKPVWLAIFEEPASVQFTHRILALLTFCKVMALVWRSKKLDCTPRQRRLFNAAGIVALCQVALGISTLLTQVDIHLAVMHQAGAMTLLGVLVWLLHDVPALPKENQARA